jgi:hypothetical protein
MQAIRIYQLNLVAQALLFIRAVYGTLTSVVSIDLYKIKGN